jgi:hypothetical protein
VERGFYIPTFYDVRLRDDGTIEAFVPRPETGAPPMVKKAALKTTEAVDPPASTVFTPDTELGSRFLVEVVRGCANLCRFCWAGYNYLPVRAFPKDRILELARKARPYSDRAGLVSIALCDHPEIEEILTSLVDMGYSISPASLRLDDLTPTILSLLRRSGERRSRSRRDGLRPAARVINKTVTERRNPYRRRHDFRERVREPEALFHDRPADGERCDLDRHRDMTLQLREIMLRHQRGRGHLGRIIGSVNPLVPKPGTCVSVAADGGRSLDRPQDQAGCEA